MPNASSDRAGQVRLFKVVDAAFKAGDASMLAAILGSAHWFDEPLPWGTGRDYALEHAVYWAPITLIEFMLEAGANPNHPHNGFPSIVAALSTAVVSPRADHLDVLRLLIGHGADVNATGPYFGTPLHYAALTKNAAAIEILLAAGADPTIHESKRAGSTALARARLYGFNEGVAILERAMRGWQPN
jgi:hypothetical protein